MSRVKVQATTDCGLGRGDKARMPQSTLKDSSSQTRPPDLSKIKASSVPSKTTSRKMASQRGPHHVPTQRGPHHKTSYQEAPHQSQSSQTKEAPQMTYHGSFMMKQPNEKKRQEILAMAKREEEAYEKHRAANRMGRITEPPRRLGGGDAGIPGMGIQDARQRQQMQAASSGPHRAAQKARLTREEARAEEDEELRKRKEGARMHAMKNAEKAKKLEAVDVEDLRQRRLQFLGQ